MSEEARGGYSGNDRRRIREDLSCGVDVLIVGGGINGAGLARDLSLRGVHVGLLEKEDFAYGTSSRSSSLIHGGLRYLEKAQLGLVFESVTERWRLSVLARHLVRPLPFIFPAWEGARIPLWMLGIGVSIYDALALFRNYENHRKVTAAEIERELPAMDERRNKGGLRYYDYRTTDARLVLENILGAWEAGALPLSRARVTGGIWDGSGAGTRRLAGAIAKDELTGETFRVPAKVVVSTTGPWTDDAFRALGVTPPPRPLLRPTKGVHVVVPSEKLPLKAAAAMTHPRDGRVLFALPFHERSVLGTTDTDYTGSPDKVSVESSDVDYLLEVVVGLFPDTRIGREDVIASWAGLRPLLNADEKSASSVSREQKTLRTPEGLVALFGGKLTTYRQMCEDLADVVVRELRAHGGPRSLRACATKSEPLPGAVGLDTDEDLARLADSLVHRAGGRAPRDVAVHLVETYGVRAEDVLDRAAHDPSGALWRRMVPDLPHLWVEVAWAAEREMGLSLEDVLIRRLGVFYRARDQGLAAAPEAARILQRALHWNDATTLAQITRYETAVAEGRRWRTETTGGAQPAAAKQPERQAG